MPKTDNILEYYRLFQESVWYSEVTVSLEFNPLWRLYFEMCCVKQYPEESEITGFPNSDLG